MIRDWCRDAPHFQPLHTPSQPLFSPLFHPSRTVILTKKRVVKLVKLLGRQIIRDWWQDAGCFFRSIDDYALEVKVGVDR